MFGRGKFQNGILIEPAEDFPVDPKNVKEVEAFRNRIWYVFATEFRPDTYTQCPSFRPSVERANANAPQHSRIFKEVCVVSSMWV